MAKAPAQPPGTIPQEGEPPPARPAPQALRHARLAAALRDNLRRRKAQARARAAAPPPPPDRDDT
jgi:hypothetical protein